MRGPKKILYDNRGVMELLWLFVELGQPLAVAVPPWIENCAASARCLGGNRPSSPNALLTALSQLPYLSYELVEQYINRKGNAMGDEPYGRTHCYSFFQRLKAASKSISHYYEIRYEQPLNPHID